MKRFLLIFWGTMIMALLASNVIVAQTVRELREKAQNYLRAKDYKNAKTYFKMAADNGDGQSMKAIADMYKEGQGGKDYMLAAIYYQKAAEKGISNAYFGKGLVYYYGGYNLLKDAKTAASCFLKSANLGEVGGQRWIGYLYKIGDGVPKDREKAKMWYQKAAAQGDIFSTTELQSMGVKVAKTTTKTKTTNNTNTTTTTTKTTTTTTSSKPRATLTWISSPTTTTNRKYTLKAGIKSKSTIENVVVKLNGQSDRGIKTVSADGYDMMINKDFTLAQGTNTIRVSVTNEGGTATFERTVTYTPASDNRTSAQNVNTTPSSNKTTKPATNTTKKINTNERRVAFVVGNSNYNDTSMKLANPVNDAADLAAKLVNLGFVVVRSLNQTKQGLENAAQLFSEKAKNADVALFFYAGHGIQYQGDNYLVPIDAKLPSEDYVKYNCTNANLVLDLMENAGCKMKIVILDACRNNPFARSWHRGVGNGGLGIMNAPKGTFIAFSTAPGDVALDGNTGQRNSPYTAALLKTLNKKGLSITDFFQEVLERVATSTNEKQTPWTSNSFRGKFVFNPE